MPQYIFIALTVAAVVVSLMGLRMYGDWISMTTGRDGVDSEPLEMLHETLTGWVTRHLCCATAATILCVMIRLVPSLHAFPGADVMLAGYGVLSLIFASFDQVLSQHAVMVLKQSGKGRG